MKHIIEGFKTDGGKHCITNSLKQIFEYYGYPISEEMLLGIGSGINFLYLNQQRSPLVAGRSKVLDFEYKIADRFRIKINCKKSKNNEKVFRDTIAMLNQDNPVFAYADMPYLEYLNMDAAGHFGGHAVVIFGYDDENGIFYVSDRDNHDYPIRTSKGNIAEDYHLVGYGQMERARGSRFRPFPADNKALEFDFKCYQGITVASIREAVLETCENMLNAPAKLLGLNGIRKFSGEIVKWNRFDDQKLGIAGVTNYFQISADGGTGGGIFRKMYGLFLIEAGDILRIPAFETIGYRFIKISEIWDEVADYMWELSETKDTGLLKKMSGLIENLYRKELTAFTELKEAAESIEFTGLQS